MRRYSGLSLVIYHLVLCLKLVIFGSDRSLRNHSVCQYPRSPERGHLAAGVMTHDTSRSFVTCLRLVIFGSDRSSKNHSVCPYPGSTEHGHQAAGVITTWFQIGHFASDWLFFGSDRSSWDHAVRLSLWHKLENKSSSFDFITHDDFRMIHINFLFQEQF